MLSSRAVGMASTLQRASTSQNQVRSATIMQPQMKYGNIMRPGQVVCMTATEPKSTKENRLVYPTNNLRYLHGNDTLYRGYQERAVEPEPQGRLRIFSGSANPQLSKDIAMYLGLDLGEVYIKRFADGEVYVQLQESIRGCDVFLIQPTCPPTNDHLMELLVMIDACRRASARNITAVIPYFGYARADRRTSGRESIAAKLTANLLTRSGCDRVIAMDLHSGQCAGYFDIPVENVAGQIVALDYLASRGMTPAEVVVVSPDVGGVARARGFAKRLADAPLAIVDKRRQAHNVAKVYNLIGDVEGKVALLVDDMIDTAGTLSAAASLLRDSGAAKVIACASHAVFSPPAVERLSNGDFEEVIVTDSIPLSQDQRFPELTVLSTANLLAETIWRVHTESSVIKLM